MTPGNAVAIDVFAERGERTVNVQVKAIRNRKSIGWPLCPRAAVQGGLSAQRLLRVSPSRGGSRRPIAGVRFTEAGQTDRASSRLVPNIFEAKPADFQKATMRVFHTKGRASRLEVFIVR